MGKATGKAECRPFYLGALYLVCKFSEVDKLPLFHVVRPWRRLASTVRWLSFASLNHISSFQNQNRRKTSSDWYI